MAIKLLPAISYSDKWAKSKKAPAELTDERFLRKVYLLLSIATVTKIKANKILLLYKKEYPSILTHCLKVDPHWLLGRKAEPAGIEQLQTAGYCRDAKITPV